MATPTDILNLAAAEVLSDLAVPRLVSSTSQDAVDFVCRNIQNRAGARLLLACVLAKIDRPEINVRKPYTEINTDDAFSGRVYDESFLGPFINRHQLPCNPTTAFLTPALRNRNIVLTPDVNLVGRPPQLYQTVLDILNSIYEGELEPRAVLLEALRVLFIVKAERAQRIESLLAGLRTSKQAAIPLSAENIVVLIQQHLSCKGARRLPVLIVAAAYTAAESQLGERARPLNAHNAVDLQTGSVGDVEIILVSDDRIVTSYEMKMKRVTREDIDHALMKVREAGQRIDNYIFITTDAIEVGVAEYAASLYEQTAGVEFVVLDCIGFLRHFLHLFHRLRQDFLDWYQEFVLLEPDSAVRQELKARFCRCAKPPRVAQPPSDRRLCGDRPAPRSM
jgi:hypothetical protein